MAPTRALAGRLSKKLLLPVVGRNKGKRNELNRYIIIFIGRVSFYFFCNMEFCGYIELEIRKKVTIIV